MKPMTAALVELYDALVDADIAHAFGGALALAWCTRDPRATNDVDLNVFVGTDELARVLAALPDSIEVTDHDVDVLDRDGQQRLYWEDLPVDVFLNTTSFHEDVARRVVYHPFLGRSMPFLSPEDLAVFKAFFNRPKDWLDLAEMASAGSIDGDAVLGVVVRLLGPDDERVARLRALLVAPSDPADLKPEPNVRDLLDGREGRATR